MMSWDDPSLSDFEDAIIEDTVHCARCQGSWSISETYVFDTRTICFECVQDEIDGLFLELASLRETVENLGRKGKE
jgi:formylmethanofuran dehydrogenase subunit E